MSHLPRALLVGFFQTIGDLECLYAVQRQLDADGVQYDIAPFRDHVRQAIEEAVAIDSAQPDAYTHVYVICGPCTPAFFEKFGLDRFHDAGLRFVGVNLTMIEPLARWNPFDILVERDSQRVVRPDLTFSIDTPRVPVISTCFIEGQSEYGDRQRHSAVIDVVNRFVRSNEIARITLDTRWPREKNAADLASPAEITSALSRTDLLITNRLHGLVFALKAGIPVIAIDAVAGGGKLSQQAECIQWPCVIAGDTLDFEQLTQALTWCRSDDAISAVERSRDFGRAFDHGLDRAFANAYPLRPKAPRVRHRTAPQHTVPSPRRALSSIKRRMKTLIKR